MVLSSAMGSLTIVGHGYGNGILMEDGPTSWETYGSFVNSINAQNVRLLNCNSTTVKQYVEIDVVSFGGMINA